MTNYRWNADQPAQDYDAAAEHIHPHYLEIQDKILQLLQEKELGAPLIVDLGGGSGRLMERILQSIPQAMGVVIDQSDAFLALAAERLQRFGVRANLSQHRLQDDWSTDLPGSVDAIISTSAIHHLDPQEKQALFTQCHECLQPNGTFINGDEYRPADQDEYFQLLKNWSDHMRAKLETGSIAVSFGEMVDRWHERNITEFSRPKQSGDDCHETVQEQIDSLQRWGFHQVTLHWQQDLWGVLQAVKS